MKRNKLKAAGQDKVPYFLKIRVGLQISVKNQGVFHPAGSAAEKAVGKAPQTDMAGPDQQNIELPETGLVNPLIRSDNRSLIHNDRIAFGIPLGNMNFRKGGRCFRKFGRRILEVMDEIAPRAGRVVADVFRVTGTQGFRGPEKDRSPDSQAAQVNVGVGTDRLIRSARIFYNAKFVPARAEIIGEKRVCGFG